MHTERPGRARRELAPLHDDAVWDPLPIAAALNAPYTQRADERYGLGVRFSVGEEPALDLTIYPHTETVQLTSAEGSGTYFHQRQPTILTDAVVFQADLPTERRFIHVAHTGQYTVLRTPGPAFQDPEQEHSPDTASRCPISLVGHLGEAPTARRSRTGGLIVRFPFAEHRPEGEFVLHQAYSTKQYAERIEEECYQAGDEATLVGEVQRQPVRGTSGELVTRDVIYCYRLTRRTDTP